MTRLSYWAQRKPSYLEQHKPSVLLARIKEQRRIRMARSAPSYPRILLCRPQGGLNDTLCQIHRCIIYAFVHHRKLIIDTTRAGFLMNFPISSRRLLLFQTSKPDSTLPTCQG
jgi:hypothetical protein